MDKTPDPMAQIEAAISAYQQASMNGSGRDEYAALLALIRALAAQPGQGEPLAWRYWNGKFNSYDFAEQLEAIRTEDRSSAEPLCLHTRTSAPEDLREFLGQIVRMIWIEWAKEQPSPKPSWLLPWSDLSEPDREVDRRIGERLYRIGVDGLYATPPTPSPSELERNSRYEEFVQRMKKAYPEKFPMPDDHTLRVAAASKQPSHVKDSDDYQTGYILGYRSATPTPDEAGVRAEWQPTHEHYKGGLYRFEMDAVMEASEERVAVYTGQLGGRWVRPLAEFNEKFTPIAGYRAALLGETK